MKYLCIGLLVSTLALACSCSGRIEKPEDAVERMVRAYGGRERIAMLTSFKGLGFIKDLRSDTVARSYPYDIYQKGTLFKSRITVIKSSVVVDVRISIDDGRERYLWQHSSGKRNVPEWEFELIKYKFPLALEWLQDPEVAGTVVTTPDDTGSYRLRYEVGDDIVTYTINGSSWLLEKMEVASVSDTSFSFSEAYGDYRKIEGNMPFPNRFTGVYREMPYYEFFIPVIEYGIDIPDAFFRVTAEDTHGVVKLVPAEKAKEPAGEVPPEKSDTAP
ncbi:MAG: hypothetical protein JSV33_10345 [bacterium]|nr:MAG: hypothetical protein JSV33_10345 [bacterium]